MNDIRIKLGVPRDDLNRFNDASFYADPCPLCIAYVMFGDRVIEVECVGEMSVFYTVDAGTEDEFREVIRYGDHMRSLFGSDDLLSEAEDKGLIEWRHNPWFTLFSNGDVELNETDSNVFHSIPEALAAAACYLKTGQFDGECGINEC